MPDKLLVEGKFENLREYLLEVEEILKSNDAMIASDFRLLRALERNFQLIVDEILDVNIHFIRELDLKTADDFQSTFVILAEGGVLPVDFATRIAPIVGLRNALVHRYEKIYKDFFISQVRKEYQDFIQYMKLIDDYLRKI